MKKNLRETLFTKKRGKAEITALILYIIGTSVITFFHEPWFDESQVWLIARSASVKDIIFRIQHYEGHSPLWALMLVPFAKSGAPFELTIAVINILFASAAMAVLLFRSPFPKIVRCLLPFTYFFFYQYGVISRPYCLLMLAFMLMGATYKKRNEKPIPFVLSMALLCLSHSYGIVLAGGISIVWVCEIFSKHIKNGNLKGVFKEKSCYALLGLAVLAVTLICLMIPAKDVHYSGMEKSFVERLSQLEYVLLMPADATFSAYIGYMGRDQLGTVFDMFMGAIVLSAIVYASYKNKKLALFLVPYLMGIMFIILYFSVHQMGIFTCFFVFIFWVICDDPCGDYTKLREKAQLISSKINSKALRGAAVCVAVFVALSPVFHSIASSYHEIKYKYCYGRELADFLKETGLSERKIMVEWAFIYDIPEEDKPEDNGETGLGGSEEEIDFSKYYHTDVRTDYTNMTAHTTVLAYMDDNIFMNHHINDRSMLYFEYRIPTREEADEDLKKWHDEGLPEVIINSCTLEMVYSDDELQYPYLPVASFDYGMIFKYMYYDSKPVKVYLRKDLFDEYPELHELKY